MEIDDRFLRASIGSAVLALLLVALAGPPGVTAAREPSQPTGHDCTHVYSERKTPPGCEGFETGAGGELVPSDCTDREPTDVDQVSREQRLVRLVESPTRTPVGNFVDESEANTIAAGRDGGLVLRLRGSHEVFKSLALEKGKPCCHDLISDGSVTVSGNILIDALLEPGLAFGLVVSEGTLRLKADCKNGKNLEKRMTVVVSAFRRLLPTGERLDMATTRVQEDGGKPEIKNPPFPDPNLGGAASQARSFALEQTGAGVERKATAEFSGEHSVSVRAPAGSDLTAKARGRTRLKFLSHYDDTEKRGSLPP